MSSKKPLAPKHVYFQRLFKSFMVATIYMTFSLTLGVLGYHYWGKLEWIDALVNASMILGGMGPVDVVKTNSGKIFTSFYALYSGISFLTAFAILIAPALHRLLHKLKLEVEE